MRAGCSVKAAAGIVTVVQEQRFLLAADDGSTRLFILTHKAPIEGRDLQGLRGRGARVEVHYEDVPDLAAHVAYRIYERTA
jgi:hypothetical protein